MTGEDLHSKIPEHKFENEFKRVNIMAEEDEGYKSRKNGNDCKENLSDDVYVAVVGSINMDLVVSSERWPKPGETLLGSSRENFFGGKGANQAVAASRAGAYVRMIGCVGDDSDGTAVLDNLSNNGVDITSCARLKDSTTGLAVITVCQGDNTIIVVPGANSLLSPDYLKTQLDVIRKASVVLLQMEIPLESVLFTAKFCKEHGVPLILNPAPYNDAARDIIQSAAYITPNEHEAALLFPDKKTLDQQFEEAGERLIMTLGSQGAAYYCDGAIHQVPAEGDLVVDTTGAGDTFNGVLAACFSRGMLLDDAVRYANRASGLSVQKKGAQEGMPYLETVAEECLD